MLDTTNMPFFIHTKLVMISDVENSDLESYTEPSKYTFQLILLSRTKATSK